MISNNYQNVLNYGAVKDVVPQQINEKLPQNVQNFDAKDTVGNNTAVKSVKNANTDPVTIGLTGAIWLGLAQICQKLNNSLNNDWANSWLGKAGALGEKIGNKLPKGSGRVKNFINGLFDKSAILQSLKTPTKAQNSLAKSQARGITGYVMSDVRSMLEYHLKNGKGDDIINLAKGINGFSGNADESLKFISDLFENCEDNKTQIQELIKRLGSKDVKVAVENIVDTRIGIPFTNIGFNLKIPNIPFLKRQGSFKEMANKLNAVFENSAGLGKEVTAIGKSAPKQAIKTLEGLTNGGAGGKILIVIQAAMFAQAIKKAMDAPKGEKLSTFTENVANDFGFFLSLPLQVKASHAIGGLKYIGIKDWDKIGQKESVKVFHNMIESLNKRVVEGTISQVDYIKEAKNIKKYLKGDSKWYQQPLKLLGKIFSTGLDAETILPYIDKADKSFGAQLYHGAMGIVNNLKGKGFGTVLRFAAGTMVVGPLVAKVVTKISHLIFGRPTKSVLDEDKKEEKTQDANNPLEMTQEEMMQKLSSNPELMQKMENDPEFLQKVLEDPELFKKLLNKEINPNEVATTKDNPVYNSKYIKQTPLNANQNPIEQPKTLNAFDDSNSKAELFGLGKKTQEQQAQQEQEQTQTEQQDPLEPVRTYIPSSECTIKSSDGQEVLDPEINKALQKAQKAEEAALKQLNSL